MARKTIITLISDLSGDEADTTLEFSVGGRHYRLDLTDAEHKEFNDLIEPYTEQAQKVSKGGQQARLRSRTSNSPATSGERAKIRAWAQENGHSIGDRGRIAQHIRDAYYAAGEK